MKKQILTTLILLATLAGYAQSVSVTTLQPAGAAAQMIPPFPGPTGPPIPVPPGPIVPR